jgi:DNA polymerase-4
VKNDIDFRKIIHIDMDAFYASVEQMDNPNLKGKPVAVGGSRERGVVAAASYEARKYGVHSAMPSLRAAKLCHNLIFLKPRFNRYKELSHQIRDIFFDYTDLVEPLSLDEAYLDVTRVKKGPNSATLLGREIKNRIRNEVGLTASAGISYNKFLAKTASDMEKPDGLYTILPNEAGDFIAHLPVKKFHGIGAVTADKMHRAGIFNGNDLRKKSREDLILRFGKAGHYYYEIARGIDNRPVSTDRPTKSLSAERTFDHDVMKLDEIWAKFHPIRDEVYRRYKRAGMKGKTITLKIKYGDFRQATKSKTTETYIGTEQEFNDLADAFIHSEILKEEGIRLLGLGISNFEKERQVTQQLVLKF